MCAEQRAGQTSEIEMFKHTQFVLRQLMPYQVVPVCKTRGKVCMSLVNRFAQDAVYVRPQAGLSVGK